MKGAALPPESNIFFVKISNLSRLRAVKTTIAPASANIIARTANGLADDLASTVILASNKPIVFAPAMNTQMWNNPATKRNILFLKENGISFIGPEPGDLACGEHGLGRMTEPLEIYKHILSLIKNKKKKNIKALVTAGPTYEPIDPVRFIGNRSSGKQGIAIANQLKNLGLDVTLVTGPTHQQIASEVNIIRVNTAKEMFTACKETLPVDVAICAAAVSDWTVNTPSSSKIKKNNTLKPEIKFSISPDILDSISKAGNKRPKLVIGFAAETDNLIQNAKKKLEEKKCDWILANNILDDPDVFGGDKNTIKLISKNNIEEWPKTTKNDIARLLSKRIIEKISKI